MERAGPHVGFAAERGLTFEPRHDLHPVADPSDARCAYELNAYWGPEPDDVQLGLERGHLAAVVVAGNRDVDQTQQCKWIAERLDR